MNLCGKKILLGVTGGIAAYKTCTLLRLLQKEGAEVRVSMTSAATKFVAPLTFASLSKCPVYLENGTLEARPFQHIDFPRWADLYLIAPCSANTIGKIANGIADDPVSLCFMPCAGEKWIAPAMNVTMYSSFAVQQNLERLKANGVHVLESPKGELACGETGEGRMAEPEEILNALKNAKEVKNVCKNGKRVLITAGRTEELIDPVRYISNRSSGKTATAIASVFYEAGFDVTMVCGPMDVAAPGFSKVVNVRSAIEMHEAVLSRAKDYDVLVHCAAVADYRPAEVANEKIKDSRSQLHLDLIPNPNILRDSVAQKRKGQVVVGFALETEKPELHAKEKLEKSGADLLVLNMPVAKESGFGKDNVAFSLVEKGGAVPELQMASKRDLALGILRFTLLELEKTK
jgi:phosphopantothenoylcysteine decarboxylase/phosphopantothenate--cysteine ligase